MTPTIRTLELRYPSVRDEAASVIQALGVIALVSLLLIGRHWTTAATTGALEAPDYQILFRNLPVAEQRTFLRVQEGLTEAELARSTLGAWPPPEMLSAQGIPPFAPDPLNPKLTWSLQVTGSDAQYLGLPGGSSPAFLLLIQEPPAGIVGDPASTPLDETHHRLRSGMIIHVSIWEHLAGPVEATPQVLARPYLAGWRQIVVTPPTLRRRDLSEQHRSGG